MKKNIMFLILGISSSIISKIIQLYTSSKIGDVIVLFSALFFVCAISFSIKRFNQLFDNEKTKLYAIKTLVFTFIPVVTFQIMMILIVNKVFLGLILVIPICIFVYISIIQWKRILINR
jgi:hypothetical protein